MVARIPTVCLLLVLASLTQSQADAEDIAVGDTTGVWPLAGSLIAPTPTPAPGTVAGPNPNTCPETIEHVEFSQLAEVEETVIYSVDFDRIKLDGEKCSDRDPVKDRMLIIPSKPAISTLTNIPEVDTLNLQALFSSDFAGNELQSFVDSLTVGSFLLGFDLGDRSCGDQETPANTPYLFVSPTDDKTLATAEGVVIKGGKDNMISMNGEAVCVYTRSRPASPAEAVEDTLDKIKSCFPGAAMVQLENGRHVPMDQLQVGDRVLVGPGIFSDVYSFTHREQGSIHKFIQISTLSGHLLLVSPGHYLPVGGSLKAANAVLVGESVVLGDGSVSAVVSVTTKFSSGLFNPQTLHGNIVVDGVLASTYTTGLDPEVAHVASAPMRALYNWFGVSTAVFESGAKSIADSLPMGSSVVH